MTNAPQELVRLDKKAEIILSDGRFAELFEIKAGHLLAAEDPSEHKKIMKLILQVVKVDDKKLDIDEVLNLPMQDYQEIVKQLLK